jgi:hypothetical protein
MKTIRVVIEAPPPGRSQADAVVTQLADVSTLVRAWTAGEQLR